MLAVRPRSGYEIKQLVDTSARFFWAASYGQIYPELKRLEKTGLVASSDGARGGRRRTVYELTDSGREAAREWIASPPEIFETRDEGLLKLFFAGWIEPERAAGIARERAAHAREKAETLRGIQELLEGRTDYDGPEYERDVASETVLRFGIDYADWVSEWFERAAEELENEQSDRRRGT